MGFYGRLGINSVFSVDSAFSEILRITIVYIHATLEDFFRRFAVTYCALAGEEAVKGIRIHVLDQEKSDITIVDLLKMKEYQVSELIDNSIRSHYDKSSFNNKEQIVAFLADTFYSQ